MGIMSWVFWLVISLLLVFIGFLMTIISLWLSQLPSDEELPANRKTQKKWLVNALYFLPSIALILRSLKEIHENSDESTSEEPLTREILKHKRRHLNGARLIYMDYHWAAAFNRNAIQGIVVGGKIYGERRTSPSFSFDYSLGDSSFAVKCINNNTWVSLNIKNARGKTIVNIEENRWNVYEDDSIHDWNFCFNALEIIGRDGEVALQVIVWEHAAAIAGHLSVLNPNLDDILPLLQERDKKYDIALYNSGSLFEYPSGEHSGMPGKDVKIFDPEHIYSEGKFKTGPLRVAECRLLPHEVLWMCVVMPMGSDPPFTWLPMSYCFAKGDSD